MLEMNGLQKVFRSGLVETHALRDFSLTVDAGEFVAVTGPSGSGKTTFLNIAGLLDGFSGGSYFLDGYNVTQLNDARRSKMRNQKLGFIFQSFNLIADLNIFDNVDVPLRYRGFSGRERKKRIDKMLEMVGLLGRKKHFPGQLSGGQQQRVAIARALAGEPRMILADEPTGNLDTLMAKQIMELLEDVNRQGTTVIMVTHDPNLARRANRHIQIVDGQLTDFQMYEPLSKIQQTAVAV
ncbi:putative ABC transport system ATP-binding protein [Alteromonadaceae bacterium Bs31]|nr:putative ABC transport system ATP-binding protein [Alteromonadaceae bacterium Bs31]